MKTYEQFVNEGFFDRKLIRDVFSLAYNKAIKHFIDLHEKITEEHIIKYIDMYMNANYGVSFPHTHAAYKYIKHLVHIRLLKNKIDIKNPNVITKELQNLIDQQKSEQQLNEGYELSGKHSFLTFLQVVSNHDYHFILNDHFTKLYNYHFFFSTETIQDVEEFVDIFKYKHSLASTYEILLKIKSNRLAFFFGVKENTLLRYGFADLDSQRSYVVGEFNVTGTYFRSIVKYKALQTINKILQNVDVKNLSTLSKVKQDFEKFYTSKKSSKIRIDDNRVINYFDKNQFTEEDLQMNRLFRILDKWVSKKSWRNRVEISVDDTTDPIQFIIIVK